MLSRSPFELSIRPFPIHSTLNSLSISFQELRARIEVLEVHPNPAPMDPAIPGTSAGSGTPVVSSPGPLALCNSASALSVTPAHFIPGNIRGNILDGKDLNLVSLLIAAHDVADNKSYACGDISVNVKSRDVRLNRKLSVTVFVLAFRDIICSVSPHRREELDLYL